MPRTISSSGIDGASGSAAVWTGDARHVQHPAAQSAHPGRREMHEPVEHVVADEGAGAVRHFARSPAATIAAAMSLTGNLAK
jgi:hypothetical protein